MRVSCQCVGKVYHDLGNLNYSFITDAGDATRRLSATPLKQNAPHTVRPDGDVSPSFGHGACLPKLFKNQLHQAAFLRFFKGVRSPGNAGGLSQP